MSVNISRQVARAIEELAATAFWRHVAAHGYQATFGSIDAAAAEKLLIETFTADQVAAYMSRRGIPGKPVHVVQQATAVLVRAQEAGRNLMGPILPEDIQLCRPASVTPEMLEQIVVLPKSIIGGGVLAAYGALVVRPPYPALVIGNSKPPAGVFIIKDTVRALGRQVFMLAQTSKTTPMANGILLTEATMLVPAPNQEHGDLWEKLIPNSTRSTDAMRVVTKDGLNEITFGW